MSGRNTERNLKLANLFRYTLISPKFRATVLRILSDSENEIFKLNRNQRAGAFKTIYLFSESVDRIVSNFRERDVLWNFSFVIRQLKTK